MAINKNHEFEELNGVKCAIVEKNATAQRVAFLKELLEFNGYTTVVLASPPPKVAPASPPQSIAQPQSQPQSQSQPQPQPQSQSQPQPQSQPESQPQPQPSPQPPPPETFTIGVTDVTFNPTNAIFGRLLKTRNGHVVTLAYWNQKETISQDDVPYYEA